jgi:hypothetical protein
MIRNWQGVRFPLPKHVASGSSWGSVAVIEVRRYLVAKTKKETFRNSAIILRSRIADYLGLERNVAAASSAMLLLGAGEELWKKFLPKYLESLGAGPGIIGLFGTAEDFFDALYQYPGGWLADRAGRRRAFITFITIASVGYFV